MVQEALHKIEEAADLLRSALELESAHAAIDAAQVEVAGPPPELAVPAEPAPAEPAPVAAPAEPAESENDPYAHLRKEEGAPDLYASSPADEAAAAEESSSPPSSDA